MIYGRYAGVTEVDKNIRLVSVPDYDSGFFDEDVNRDEPVGENPFTPKVLPMSPVWTLAPLAFPSGRVSELDDLGCLKSETIVNLNNETLF